MKNVLVQIFVTLSASGFANPALAQSLQPGQSKAEFRRAIPARATLSDDCSKISPAILDSYARDIGSALSWATKDAAQNGASGQ